MYSWLWRRLPGPLPVRLGLALVAVTVVIAVLMLVVFPWVQSMLAFNRVTVGS